MTLLILSLVYLAIGVALICWAWPPPDEVRTPTRIWGIVVVVLLWPFVIADATSGHYLS